MPTLKERILKAGSIFTPTSPVDVESLFAGRHEQVASVVDSIHQKGQHAVIFGERGVGKTSLANVLTFFIPITGNRRTVTPRVNCDSNDTFQSVFLKAFGEITMYSKKQGAGFTAPSLTQVSDVKSWLGGDVSPDNVRRGLQMLSEHVRPVLILDEFDRLNSEVKHGVADLIKSLSDHGVDATMIVVGVADSVSDLIQEHASIERAMVQIPMPRMNRAELAEILDKGAEKLGVSFHADARASIVDLARGLPHYVHLLGLHAVRVCLTENHLEVLESHVEAAISKALSGAQQSILALYHQATTSPRKDNLFAKVLLACALAPVDEMGYFAAQDVREPIRRITGKDYEIPSFSQHLNDFTDAKRGPVLQKKGDKRRWRFRFVNPLLQPFVVMCGRRDDLIARS